jgi:hypothetical protein
MKYKFPEPDPNAYPHRTYFSPLTKLRGCSLCGIQLSLEDWEKRFVLIVGEREISQ